MVVDENGNEVDPGVTAAEEANGDDGFSPSLEAQETELRAAQRSASALPQGEDAMGHAKRVADAWDKANEAERQRHYKNDPKGYKRFLGRMAFRQSADIEAAMRYEAAQLKHASNARSSQEAADIISNLGKLNTDYPCAGQTQKMATLEDAQSAKQALDRQAEMQAQEAKSSLDTGTSAGKTAAAAVDEGVKAFKASTFAEYASKAAGAENEWERGCQSLFNFNAKELGRFHERIVQMAMNNGDPSNVARAKADEATRKAAVGILNGLISNGNHDVFSRWMHTLNGTKISDELDDGQGGRVIRFDAMKRWCLGADDLKSLAEAYLKAKAKEQKIAAAETANARTAGIIQVNSIRVAGNRACYSAKLDAQTVSDYENSVAALENIAQTASDDKVSNAAREASEHLRSLWASRGRTEEKVATQVGRLNDQKEFEEYWDWLCAQGEKDIRVSLVDGSGKSEDIMADVSLVKYKALSEAIGKGLCTGKHGTSGKLWSEMLTELEKGHGVDVEEQASAVDSLRTKLRVSVVTADDKDLGDAYRAGWGKDRKKIGKDPYRFDSPFGHDDNGSPTMDRSKRFQTLRWTGTDGVERIAPWSAFDKAVNAIITAQKITPGIAQDKLVQMAERMLMSGAVDSATREFSTGWFSSRKIGGVDANEMASVRQVLEGLGVPTIPDAGGEGFKNFVKARLDVTPEFARFRKARNEARIRALKEAQGKKGGAK